MSLIVTVCVNPGIIMASDSIRMTYVGSGDNRHRTRISDVEKTFLCPNGAGISTCGDHNMNGRQADAVIREFIYKKIDKNCDIAQMPELIAEYFAGLTSNSIMVAGYDYVSLEPHVYYVVPGMTKNAGKIVRLNRNENTPVINAWWEGMDTTVDQFYSKICKSVDFARMTMQDAVDFARFGMEITIQAQRFQCAEQTVSGPIDILAITPAGSRWIQHKELH